jgi:hypothetical protein
MHSIGSSVVRRQFWRAALTLLFSLHLIVDSDARIEAMPSIQESFESAEAVLSVRVDDEKILHEGRAPCGSRYRGIVLQKFKGSFEPTQEITFGRFRGLEVDRTYLLFINYDKDPEAVFKWTKERFDLPDPKDIREKKQIINMIKCNGLIPGFIVNPRAAWKIEQGYVVIAGRRPEEMPKSIRIDEAQSLGWLLYKDDLFSYLRRLGRTNEYRR